MPKAKSSTTPKPKASRPKKPAPSHEEISRRAYEIYLERSGSPGDPHSDWLRAEAELSVSLKKGSRKSKVVSIAA